jgi:gliding motility-associated-like protein
LEEDSSSILVYEVGIYTLMVTDEFGCQYEDTTIINPLPSPVFELEDSIFIGCITDTIHVELNTILTDSIQWYTAGMEIVGWNSPVQSFINQAGGIFTILARNNFNCVTSQVITVQVLPAPEFDLGSDTTKCSNQTIPISFTPIGEAVDTIKWSLNDTEFFPNSSTFHDASEGGIYQVEVIGENGCSRSDTIIIEDLLNPDIYLPDDSTLCEGDVFLLWDQNNNIGESSWFFEGELINSNSQQISVIEAGQYILELEAENGCIGRDTTNITVSELTFPNLQEDLTFCSENQVINSNIDEIYQHEWTLNNEIIQSSAVDSLVVTQAGTYTVTVFNEDNCSASDTIIITQGEIPDIDLGEDLELCEEELANFLVNEGYMYTWLLDGEEINDETGNTLTTDKSGTYMVVATSEDGCESTDEAEVIIHPLPEIELGMDASICPEDSYNLDASCVDCEVVWNDGNTDDVRDINIAGEYIATVTNEFDCSVMDTFNLSLYEAAMPDLGEDIELCLNESVTLDPGFFSTYQWSIGTNTASIDLIAADVFAGAVVTYWVDVSTPDGCVGSDSITVTYLPLINSLIEAPADNVCLGDSLQLLATGGTFYEWSDINGNTASIRDPFSQRPTVTPTENTTYQVIVGNDCPTDLDTAYYEVAVLELPNGDAGQDTCIAEGTDIFLNATGGETYLWESNEIYPLSNLESPSPRVAPIESTTYFVTITGLNGCSVTDSVLVAVAEDPSFNIIPVNIITPNGDGKNDFLEFDNLEKFPRNTLKVYNRWGNKVYEKVGYENDWDGTYQGKPLPAGSYYYILSFQASQVVVKSALTILRE